MAESKEAALDLAELRAQMQLDRAKLTDSILAKFTASSSSSSAASSAKGKGKDKGSPIGEGATAGRKFRPATLGLGAEMRAEDERKGAATREDRRLVGLLKGKKKPMAEGAGTGSRSKAEEIDDDEEEAGRAAEVEAAAGRKRKQGIVDPFAVGNKKKKKEVQGGAAVKSNMPGKESHLESEGIVEANANESTNGEVETEGLSKAQRKKLNKRRRLEEEQAKARLAPEGDLGAAREATEEPARTSPPPQPTSNQMDALTDHQQSLLSHLSGSRFRQINETLYTSPSAAALAMIQAEPSKLQEYHQGFRKQTKSWPEIPVEKIAKIIKDRNAPLLVVDLGAGEAILAKLLREPQPSTSIGSKAKKGKGEDVPAAIRVLSYDLLDSEDGWVRGVDVAQAGGLPLPGIVGETNGARVRRASRSEYQDPAIADIAVFCLSLMGTNWVEMIIEARRVLCPGKGSLIVAEVASRFTNIDEFVKLIELLGFQLVSKDAKNTHFSLFEFRKLSDKELSSQIGGLASIKDDETERRETKMLIEKGRTLLKPCLYKRR
ncbi:hypothetical protein FA10DRAFT_266547 [Acaromyces ingoldii]|uniref:Ribosomal RNA-processing protein 8 n=1 Tax=Acaromyces ingoldii TaxID=215250 RepID=A0A316YMY8_9BASI|nr:hypothetical protein FA10DRAFT_266547 [Acaromyces ingoldii]PWN90028.1 hypothetical protein FA10DRAFT_266547 [Acaromyces ingoldii]